MALPFVPFTQRNVYGCTPVMERGFPTHIRTDASRENIVYACGRTVVIRNIRNPLLVDTYSEHNRNVTAAAISVSRQYCCSADETGKVRVWDLANKSLKSELQVLGGPIVDLAWCCENKRILAVGNGKGTHAKCVAWDGGNSLGDLTGVSKRITSGDMRPKRPMALITASEDQTVNHYEGPPFRFRKGNRDHVSGRWSNCVRYSPDGERFVSVGGDGRGVIYNANNSDRLSDFSGHTGSIYSVSWSPDGTRLLTCGADKTARIFDANTMQQISLFQFGNETHDMQNSTVWGAGDQLLTVSLSGNINYLDLANPSRPLRILKGHNKAITSLAYHPPTRGLFSGSYEGVVNTWTYDEGNTGSIDGASRDLPIHNNNIARMALLGNTLVTAGADNCVKFLDPARRTCLGSVDLDMAAVDLDCRGDYSVVTTQRSVYVVKNLATVSQQHNAVGPKKNAAAISPELNEVAVACEDNRVRIYQLDAATGRVGEEIRQLVDGHSCSVTAVRYSPDGRFIASGDQNRQIMLWDREGRIVVHQWSFHSARITSLAWRDDSKYLVSASIDSHIIVWCPEQPIHRLFLQGCHAGGVVQALFVEPNVIASAGADACIRTWNINVDEHFQRLRS